MKRKWSIVFLCLTLLGCAAKGQKSQTWIMWDHYVVSQDGVLVSQEDVLDEQNK
jgi:uncharacterized lipoprotein NlpE involved in copper resistance